MVRMVARLSTTELLSLGSAGLQKGFEAGLLTSVELVQACLAQISRHDHQGARLNAMISIVPNVILTEHSAQVDRERVAGLVKSPFHGIPIVVKVCHFESKPEIVGQWITPPLVTAISRPTIFSFETFYYTLKLLTLHRTPLRHDLLLN
ncbi:hypothetical protein GGI35DRAFT_440078 [Trichoderma velutinum]